MLQKGAKLAKGLAYEGAKTLTSQGAMSQNAMVTIITARFCSLASTLMWPCAAFFCAVIEARSALDCVHAMRSQIQ